jgi:hypothetical protein
LRFSHLQLPGKRARGGGIVRNVQNPFDRAWKNLEATGE